MLHVELCTPTHLFKMESRQRPSLATRLSFAVSHAERGETVEEPIAAATDQQIEEEIAEIKRYEVNRDYHNPSDSKRPPYESVLRLTLCPTGFHDDRYALLYALAILSCDLLLTRRTRLGPRRRPRTIAPQGSQATCSWTLRHWPVRLAIQVIRRIRGCARMDCSHHYWRCHRDERCALEYHHRVVV